MEPSVVKTKRKKWFFMISGMILTSVFAAILTLGALVLKDNNIYTNIYVESIDLGNLTKDDARVRLENIFQKELERNQVKLQYQNKIWEIPYEELGFNYLYSEALDQAYSIGRRGNYLVRLAEVYRIRKNPVFIPLKTVYDNVMLDETVDKVNGEIYRAAVDAKIHRVNNAFIITKEESGVAVDDTQLRKEIEEAIANYNNEIILIPIQYVIAPITEEKLSHIQDILGEFSTVFDSSVTGRSTNISVASKSINGTLVMPMDSFSFNSKTGPRGVKEGYQEAPVILNGQLVPGIGGGICQVSSTLYNAVVRADLEITKRQNHSLPVAYVPMGQDATVAYGYIDFQFVNNTPYPLYVESSILGNRTTVRIYGKKTQDYLIKLFSEVEETIEPKVEIKKDASIPVGEKRVEREAKKGYRVNTYKIYSMDGQEIMRELISRDLYTPVHGIIFEGTKPWPQAKNEDKPGVDDKVDDQEVKPVGGN